MDIKGLVGIIGTSHRSYNKPLLRNNGNQLICQIKNNFLNKRRSEMKNYKLIKIEKVVNCFSKNCPSGINHLNPIHDVEIINKVGSDYCQKCKYFLCIKKEFVCCSQESIL